MFSQRIVPVSVPSSASDAVAVTVTGLPSATLVSALALMVGAVFGADADGAGKPTIKSAAVPDMPAAVRIASGSNSKG